MTLGCTLFAMDLRIPAAFRWSCLRQMSATAPRSLKYTHSVLIWKKKILEFGGLYVKTCKALLLVYHKQVYTNTWNFHMKKKSPKNLMLCFTNEFMIYDQIFKCWFFINKEWRNIMQVKYSNGKWICPERMDLLKFWT